MRRLQFPPFQSRTIVVVDKVSAVVPGSWRSVGAELDMHDEGFIYPSRRLAKTRPGSGLR
jgi:hypothetical protein